MIRRPPRSTLFPYTTLSDLVRRQPGRGGSPRELREEAPFQFPTALGPRPRDRPGLPRPERRREGRSEEHTSELQSQSNLVCRLLLEKKKRRLALCPRTIISA